MFKWDKEADWEESKENNETRTRNSVEDTIFFSAIFPNFFFSFETRRTPAFAEKLRDFNKTKMKKKELERNHADLHEAYQTLFGECPREGVSSDEEEEEDGKPVMAAFSIEDAFPNDDD